MGWGGIGRGEEKADGDGRVEGGGEWGVWLGRGCMVDSWEGGAW